MMRSPKVRTLLIILALIASVAFFVPRYGADAIVPIVVATSLAYFLFVLVRALVSFAARFRTK